MKPEMIIRKAVKEDLPQIETVLQEIKANMLAQGNPQWSTSYPQIDNYAHDIALERLYVAVSDGCVAGFAAFCEGEDPDYEGEMWKTPKPYMSLHRLGVALAFRGCGMARRLFALAEQYAADRQIKGMRIDTFSKNKAVPALLRSMGYQYVGDIFRTRLPDPYPCFEKEIVAK